MQQSDRRKLQWTRALICSCLVLLTAFVAFWLRSQYGAQRTVLTAQLQKMYGDVQDEQMEQVIRKGMGMALKQAPGTRSPMSVFVKTVDSPALASLPKAITVAENTALFARGVKAFVVNAGNLDIGLQAQLLDDTLVRATFGHRLQAGFGALKVRWTAAGEAPAGNDLLLYTGRAVDAGISGYQGLVVRRLWPQIAFSVFLVSLCSLAFFFSYSNIRKQLILSSQKDAFVSNIAHELKTPVTTAQLAIEALRKFDVIHDPVRAGEYLQMAGWELDRLDQLTGQVLNHFQIERGKLIIRHKPVALGQLVQEVLESLQPHFRDRRIAVTYDPPVQEITVTGDYLHLRGAVYNLVDNAVKYGQGHIWAEVGALDGGATVRIADDGPGIPPAYGKKIFEKFFRIPTGNVHDVKGYGLGLSYTLSVMEAHRGAVRQEPRPGGGAVFLLHFPNPAQR